MRASTIAVAFLLAAAVSLGAETRWARVTTPHFVVSGDASAANLERFAGRLESLRGAFIELLPRVRDRSLLPTFVVVFGNDTSFAPFRPPGVTVGGYALLEPFTPCMVLRPTRPDEAFRTIVHEYVHVLFDAPWVPAWLNEGMADYYSMTSVTRDGRKAVVGERIATHVAQASGWWVPVSEVLARPRSSRLSNNEGSESFYAESWLLVHYLMRASPARGAQLVQLIDLLAAGVPEQSAFEQAIGSPTLVELALRRYLGNGIIYGDERPLTTAAGGVVAKARPMTGAEVDATLGRLLFHLRREDEALVRLKASTGADPNLPEAAVTLGVMHARHGRKTEAADHFRRALAQDPANLLAAYHLGLMALDAARFTGVPSVDEAHAALDRAFVERPDGPTNAVTVLGTLAGRVGRLDQAEPLLRRAAAAEPEAPGTRLELANVCLRVGKFDEARRLLDALLAPPASPHVRAARQCLDWLPVAEVRAAMRAELAEAARLRDAGPDPAIARTGLFPPAPRLRTLNPGDERRLGLLDAVECSDTTFTIRVSTSAGPLTLTTTSLGRAHLSSARSDVTDSIPCGPRPAREAVYVTWTGENQLVAIEFLPADLQPQPSAANP